MKLLVFSDTHGYIENMIMAVEAECPTHVIHLGDHTADVSSLRRRFPMIPVLSVRGNCDYGDFKTQESVTADFDGIRVFAAHGHKYGVKNHLLRFLMAAKEKAVHIALFGHTHCAHCEFVDGIWLLNPGTCGYRSRGTYGVIEIENHNATCTLRMVEERKQYYDSCH